MIAEGDLFRNKDKWELVRLIEQARRIPSR